MSPGWAYSGPNLPRYALSGCCWNKASSVGAKTESCPLFWSENWKKKNRECLAGPWNSAKLRHLSQKNDLLHRRLPTSQLYAQISKRRVEIERLLTTFVTQRDLFLFYRRSAWAVRISGASVYRTRRVNDRAWILVTHTYDLCILFSMEWHPLRLEKVSSTFESGVSSTSRCGSSETISFGKSMGRNKRISWGAKWK